MEYCGPKSVHKLVLNELVGPSEDVPVKQYASPNGEYDVLSYVESLGIITQSPI